MNRAALQHFIIQAEPRPTEHDAANVVRPPATAPQQPQPDQAADEMSTAAEPQRQQQQSEHQRTDGEGGEPRNGERQTEVVTPTFSPPSSLIITTTTTTLRSRNCSGEPEPGESHPGEDKQPVNDPVVEAKNRRSDRLLSTIRAEVKENGVLVRNKIPDIQEMVVGSEPQLVSCSVDADWTTMTSTSDGKLPALDSDPHHRPTTTTTTTITTTTTSADGTSLGGQQLQDHSCADDVNLETISPLLPPPQPNLTNGSAAVVGAESDETVTSRVKLER